MTQNFYLKKVNGLFVFGRPRPIEGQFQTIIDESQVHLLLNGIDGLDIHDDYSSDFSVVSEDLGFNEPYIQSLGIDLKGYRAIDSNLTISRFTLNRNEEGDLQEAVLIQEDGINKTEYLIYTEDSQYKMLDVLFDERVLAQTREAVIEFLMEALEENMYYSILGLVDYLFTEKKLYSLLELHVLWVIDEINAYLTSYGQSEPTFQLTNEKCDKNGSLDYGDFIVEGKLNKALLKNFNKEY